MEPEQSTPASKNKGLSSTFQPPIQGRSIQRAKRCDKRGDKDEDNSPNNVDNYIMYLYTAIN